MHELLFQAKTARRLQTTVLLVFIAVIYYPALDSPFVFDDMPNIVLNTALHPHSLAELGQVLDSHVSGNRPLALLSFALNYLFFGFDARSYHLVNILIHMANTILLYTILRILPAGKTPESHGKIHLRQTTAFWAAALWAVHPVQTQAVTYIVQRMTAMAAFFYLAAITIFLFWQVKYRLAGKTAATLILICFALGLACKEIVITLPFSLLFLDWICIRRRFTDQHLKILLFLLIAGLAFCLYYYRGVFPCLTSTYPDRNFSPLQRVMTEWRIIWHYLSLLIFPLPSRLYLTFDTPISTGLLSPWTTLVSLLAIIATFLSAFTLKRRHPAAAFALLFFLLAIAPESSFINLELAFIHRLYLPSTFLFFGLLTLLPSRILRQSGPIFLLLLALFSYWSIIRNDEWNKPDKFWSLDIERSSNTARSFNNQAAALIDAGHLEKAEAIARQGLAMAVENEDKKMLLYNLGFALYHQKKYDESLSYFEQIAKSYDAYLHTHLHMGDILLRQGRQDKAKELAAWLSNQPELRYQGKLIDAAILYENGKLDEAEQLLRNTLIEEKNATVFVRQKLMLELARTYLKQNNAKAAYDIFLSIIADYPQNYSVWRMIYLMLEAGGDTKGAETVKRFLNAMGVQIEQAPTP